MKAIVTDDSKATRMILRRLLEDLDFEVLEAVDGNNLLELLESTVPDLALIDWNMPGLNGTEVITEMHKNPVWAKVPSILVTDETATERIESALRAGARSYLGKPFRPEKLKRTLETIGIRFD